MTIALLQPSPCARWSRPEHIRPNRLYGRVRSTSAPIVYRAGRHGATMRASTEEHAVWTKSSASVPPRSSWLIRGRRMVPDRVSSSLFVEKSTEELFQPLHEAFRVNGYPPVRPIGIRGHILGTNWLKFIEPPEHHLYGGARIG